MVTRERIALKANLPVLLQLQNLGAASQSKVSGRTEYRYHVLNGEGNAAAFVYLDQPGHAAIQELRPRIGDWISLTRFPNGRYQVKRSSDASEPQTPNQQPARALTPAQRITSESPSHSHPNGNANGNRYPVSHPIEERYARIFVVAAHALKRAHEQLAAEGFELDPFNWEDVRATAIHLAIAVEKKGERR